MTCKKMKVCYIPRKKKKANGKYPHRSQILNPVHKDLK